MDSLEQKSIITKLTIESSIFRSKGRLDSWRKKLVNWKLGQKKLPSMKCGETKDELSKKELKKHKKYNENVQHACNWSHGGRGGRK